MKHFKEASNKLVGEFKFENFVSAFSFMTEVAFYCEKLNHHPEWSNVYNTVSIKLCTHDAGNIITDKDKDLAVIIEDIFEKRNA